jgi:hypothetical protein
VAQYSLSLTVAVQHPSSRNSSLVQPEFNVSAVRITLNAPGGGQHHQASTTTHHLINRAERSVLSRLHSTITSKHAVGSGSKVAVQAVPKSGAPIPELQHTPVSTCPVHLGLHGRRSSHSTTLIVQQSIGLSCFDMGRSLQLLQ